MEDEKNLKDKNDDEKKLRARRGEEDRKRRDLDDDNTGSKGVYDGNEDEDGSCFQLEGIQTVKDIPTADNESMKAEMKIKEKIWHETRKLD